MTKLACSCQRGLYEYYRDLPMTTGPNGNCRGKEKLMDKELEQAITDIEALFPTDSRYEDTSLIGQKLLAQAKREVEGWRTESRAVILRYAQLCRAEEGKTR